MRKVIFGVVTTVAALAIVVGCLLLVRPDDAAGPQPTVQMSATRFDIETKTLSDLVVSQGVQAALAHVRTQVQTDPSYARECHPLLHHLGRTALEQAGSFAAAMASSDELCNSGYIHGVIEGNFAQAQSLDAALQSSCPSAGVEDFALWQCYHGMGHGAMTYADRNVASAVAACGQLPSKFASESCVNGVFMEAFITVDHTGAHKSHQNVPGMELCKTQTDANKAVCYVYAPTAYLGTHSNQYEQAVDWCNSAEPAQVANCIAGVGSQVMKENITNPAYAARFCKQISSKHKSSCASGAVGLFINHHASSKRAEPLCGKEFSYAKNTCQTAIEQARILRI